MTKYEVTVEGYGYSVWEVEADTEEDAIENYHQGIEKYTDLSSIDRVYVE